MSAPVLHEQYGVLTTFHNDEGDVTHETISNIHLFDTQAKAEEHVEWLLHYRRPYLRDAAEHEEQEESERGHLTSNYARHALREELRQSYSVIRREITPWERVS
jgi:hypothetical protein